MTRPTIIFEVVTSVISGMESAAEAADAEYAAHGASPRFLDLLRVLLEAERALTSPLLPEFSPIALPKERSSDD